MKNSNDLSSTIKTQASYTTQIIQEQIDILQNKYWQMHNEISEVSYDSTYSQFKALSELGQLAIAIESLINTRHQFQKID